MSEAWKWMLGWTTLGLAGVGATLYSAVNHQWFSFVLGVLVTWMSTCLQAVCAEEIESAA